LGSRGRTVDVIWCSARVGAGHPELPDQPI